MKKKHLIIIILLITICANSQNNGKVTYLISSVLDVGKIKTNESSNKSKLTAKSNEVLQKLIQSSSDVEAVLKFNQNESIYNMKNVMKNDSETGINFTKIQAGGNSVYYKNNITKENIKVENQLLGETFSIQVAEYTWELTSDKKRIGEYVCYKAKSNRQYKGKRYNTIVWYCPEISVNFGPKDYNGLPGLILELNDNTISYKATKIELNMNKITIKRPAKGKIISISEYKKLLNDFFQEKLFTND